MSKESDGDSSSEICTHRPSLSPQSEISRNIVGVSEGVPKRKVKHWVIAKIKALHLR